MNTRSFENGLDVYRGRQEIPPVTEEETVSTDALVFDKAEKAESVSRLREKLEEAQDRLKVCKEMADDSSNPQAAEAAANECVALEERVKRLEAVIATREAKISEQ